jgi:NTP pyrophosphatase (non-canonical NTP hydrolase)
MKGKTISLPCLDALNPTLESTALKLMEETGELAQAIGKYRGMSGERSFPEQKQVVQLIVEELVDVAQTAVTMMYVLEREYDVDIEQTLRRHLKKMMLKGYMSGANNLPDMLIADTKDE